LLWAGAEHGIAVIAASVRRSGARKALEEVAMEVTTTRNGSDAVVTVSGDVDVETAPKLEAAFSQIFDEGAQRIVVDLAGVAFLGSSGLSVLIGAQRRATYFELAPGNRIVDRLIELTGLGLLYGDTNSD
jgi:anti-sigma B factor antagonist